MGSNTYIFERELRSALDKLPVASVNSWFDYLFLKEDLTCTWKVIRIIYDRVEINQALPNWITTITCEILWKQIGRFNEEIDIYIDQILTIISVINCDQSPTCSGTLRECLLSRSIPTSKVHSSVLTAIVALYGGLERIYSKTKRKTTVTFAAE